MKHLLSLSAAGLIIVATSMLLKESDSQTLALDLPSLAIVGGGLSLATALGLSAGSGASTVLSGVANLLGLPGLPGAPQPNRRVVPISELRNIQTPFRVVGFQRQGRSVDSEEDTLNDHNRTVPTLDEGLAWINGIQLHAEIMRSADPAECYQRVFCNMAATSEGYETIRPMLEILDEDRVPPTITQQLPGDARQMLRQLEVAFQIGGIVNSEQICESIYQCPKSGRQIEADTSIIKKELDAIQNV